MTAWIWATASGGRSSQGGALSIRRIGGVGSLSGRRWHRWSPLAGGESLLCRGAPLYPPGDAGFAGDLGETNEAASRTAEADRVC